MEKIALNAEVIENLEFFLNRYGNDSFMKNVVNGGFSLSFKMLNQISISDAAKIISVGYKLKKEPIQEISEVYKENFFKYLSSEGKESDYAFGFANGIRFSVEKLGLKLMVID